jgi:ABC-type amino acid transport substrate-binding protein
MLSSAPALSQESGGTLERIARSGEIRIGYRTDASPLSYENADGEPSGYSVDLCRRIATAVKSHLRNSEIETEFVAVSSDDRIDAVLSGKIDIECGATTMTLARLEQVDFTLMTFVTGGSILTIADSGVRALSDLSGKKVGVVHGTTTVSSLNSQLREDLIDAEVIELASREVAMNQLNSGRIDAFASDQIVLIGQIIESSNPRQYSLSEELFSYEPYGLMLRRNDADFRLVANGALVQLYSSGQHIPIYNKWIGRIGIQPPPVLVAMYQLNTLPE